MEGYSRGAVLRSAPQGDVERLATVERSVARRGAACVSVAQLSTAVLLLLGRSASPRPWDVQVFPKHALHLFFPLRTCLA